VKPHIGFRVKLHSKGSGKWIDSSGDRSKFGLTSSEIVAGIASLKEHNMLECLELLHFHIGSQIPNIGTIKTSLREGVRFYTEVTKLGAQLKYLDVGGGLAVDYDGSGTGDSSLNYSVQEYANDVVSTIQTACEEAKVPEPTIITENGRAMVAHHSVLVFDVLGVNRNEASPLPQKTTDHKLIQELEYIYNNIKKENFNEFYHDVSHIKDNALQLFTFGMLSLEQKAIVDSMSWVILSKMAKIAAGDEELEDFERELREMLSDTYFCNFSVFQSLPDSWALGQLFPVMPIHRLNTKPDRRAVLVDLTCDSDGKISKFIDVATGEPKKTLEVHSFNEDEPYLMGAFLVGAYQETLGDLHNLFGDTDAVHISISEDGQYFVDNFVEGDTTAEVLSYFQYNREDLVRAIRQSCERAINSERMTRREAALMIRNYESGLNGYTYLEEPDDEPGKFLTLESSAPQSPGT
jgi:arginine decarboxylase